jgi:hypothetical protein
MGGYGSGRPATRPAEGISHRLDIRNVAAWGWIDPAGPQRGSYEWTRTRWGRVISHNSITVYVDAPRRCALLIYGVNGQDISERIELVELRGRWYWLCPCGGRALVLYMPAPRLYFRCRRCYPVVYQSSRESHQGISNTYRAMVDHLGGRPWSWRQLDDRRLIWGLKAHDRLMAKQARYSRSIGVAPDQLRVKRARWARQKLQRAARKRWANYRRREARRAARVAAYHQRRLDQPQAPAIESP